MARTYPPYAFGNRLLAETLADLASSEPHRTYASVPRTGNIADGFLDVSFGDMERMASALTGWVEDTWGRSSSFETIAYIGVPDLRSTVVFFATVRNGYKVTDIPGFRDLLTSRSCSSLRRAILLQLTPAFSSK